MSKAYKNITFPHAPGSGGPGSFQIKFEKSLKEKGCNINYKGQQNNIELIFIVGGTKQILWLLLSKFKGIPIIHRLDGISWLHKKKKISLKHYFIAEFRNFILKFIHGFIATEIVYQSKFVETWWIKEGWKKRKNTTIIYNGVDIPKFEIEDNVDGSIKLYQKRLVILEGVVDYSPYAVKLLNNLAGKLSNDIIIEVYGNFENEDNLNKLNKRIVYKGHINRKDVYKVLKGSIYMSLDINPACPNTVVEALACGAPVVAFNTGALNELVSSECGFVVDYGSNPWELNYPNEKGLINAIEKVFKNYDYYSRQARNQANKNFSIRIMTEKYLDIFAKI